MSNIRVNAITDEAGTGAPDFPNGYTVAGAVPAAAGVKTFTATGPVVSNTAVTLNADGTVSKPQGAVVFNSSFVFLENTFLFNDENVASIVKLSDTTGVLFSNTAATTLYARFFSVTESGTFTFGTRLTVTTGNLFGNLDQLFTYKVDGTKVVVAYRDTNYYVAARIVTVSGTTLSVSAQTTLITDLYNGWAMGCNNAGVMIVTAANSSGYLRARVYSVSSTISGGTETVIDTTDTFFPLENTIGATNTDWIISAYSSSNIGYQKKLVTSGATITGWSAKTQVVAAGTGSYVVGNGVKTLYDPISNKMIAVTQKVSGVSSISVVSFSMPVGTSPISYDANSKFVASSSNLNPIIVDGVVYNFATDVAEFSFNGSVFTTAQKYPYEGSDPVKSIASSTRTATNYFGFIATPVYQGSPNVYLAPMTCINTLARAGIAKETVSDGASLEVALRGGIVDGFTGLTPGKRYSISAEGAFFLASSGLDGDAIALSSTQMQYL